VNAALLLIAIKGMKIVNKSQQQSLIDSIYLSSSDGYSSDGSFFLYLQLSNCDECLPCCCAGQGQVFNHDYMGETEFFCQLSA
jgi:hypothetical protein